MENLEADGICRCCMTELLDVRYGLLEIDGLSKLYRRFSSAYLHAEDHFPKFICLSCYRQLESYDSFQNMCAQSYKILTDRFALNIFKEEILIEERDPLTDEVETEIEVAEESVNWEEVDNFLPLSPEEGSSSDKLSIEVTERGEQERTCIEEKTNNKTANTEAKGDVDGDTQSVSKKRRLPFTCALCSTNFLRKDTYERHLRVHQGLKPYGCKLCKNQYKYSEAFNAHMLSEHTENPETFPCTIEECNKVCKSKRGLKDHLYRHDNRYKNKSSIHESICDVCGKVFVSRSSLKSHTLIHNNEYPYECDICQMRFRNNALLNTHKIRKHDADSKYQCHICGAKKPNGLELRSHIAAHLDIREHICEICSKKFRTRHHLNEHKRTVHGTVKRFVCSYCGKCFIIKKRLNNHLKLHQKSLEKEMQSSHNERLK